MNNKQQTEQTLHTCMLTKLQYVLYNPMTKFLNKFNNCFCTFYIPDGLKTLFVTGHTRFIALGFHSCVFQYAKYLSFPTLLTISCLPKLFTKFYIFFRMCVPIRLSLFLLYLFYPSTKEIRGELHGVACNIRNTDEPTL